MIWPSGCIQRLPALMNARLAEFIMISSDISTNSTLRRTSRPSRPIENRKAASSRPCSIAIGVMLFVAAQVIRGDQRAEQQHRGQLDRQQIRPIQRDADLL